MLSLLLWTLSPLRKDFEVSQLNNRIEDEQAVTLQLQKKLKELQVMEQKLQRKVARVGK